jgi:hypothetical protein
MEPDRRPVLSTTSQIEHVIALRCLFMEGKGERKELIENPRTFG